MSSLAGEQRAELLGERHVVAAAVGHGDDRVVEAERHDGCRHVFEVQLRGRRRDVPVVKSHEVAVERRAALSGSLNSTNTVKL